MSDSITKIKCYLSIGLVGCERRETIDVDAEEWAAMTEEERDAFVKEVFVFEWIKWSYRDD